MKEWIHDTAFYDFRMAFEMYPSSLWVQGAHADGERAQFILEDHKDNRGLGIDNDQARNSAIQKISSEMDMFPSEADWYVRDSKGNLQALGVAEQTKMVENPQFTQLRNSGDLSSQDLSEAKREFPDVKTFEVASHFMEMTPEHDLKLGDAFGGREHDSQNGPVLDRRSGQPLNEQAPQQKQAENVQDIDLSQETFHPQEMDRGR